MKMAVACGQIWRLKVEFRIFYDAARLFHVLSLNDAFAQGNFIADVGSAPMRCNLPCDRILEIYDLISDAVRE